jgi:hypothetical protein
MGIDSWMAGPQLRRSISVHHRPPEAQPRPVDWLLLGGLALTLTTFRTGHIFSAHHCASYSSIRLLETKSANESTMSSYTVSFWDLSGFRWSCHPNKDVLSTGPDLHRKDLQVRLGMLGCCCIAQQHDGPSGLLRGQLATGRCT